MKILVTGIGGPTPKGIAHSLKLAYPDCFVVGTDIDKYASGHFTGYPYDKTYLVPSSLNDFDNYLYKMNEIVKQENIDYAFIVPETEVLVWSKLKSESKMPCPALIPDEKMAKILFDKYKVATLLFDKGLTPQTIQITNFSILNLELVGESLNYPYWVRVNKTAGAIGALKINKIDDIINWTRFNKSNDELIASPFLPGKNYACKVLFNNNKVIVSAASERIEYLLANVAPSKISGMCSRGKLINNQDLYDRSILALKTIFEKEQLPVNGMFTVDFKEDINGIPLITEINIRHVSFTNAFTMAGVNFAEQTIESFLNKKEINLGYQIFSEELNFVRGVDNELVIFKCSDIPS